MKKITLVLCACAMAFAGLLVSCNNGAGGDEEIIFKGNTSYDYAYAVSGTVVTTTNDSNDGDKADFVATTTVTKSFKNGTAKIIWNTNDDTTYSPQDYKLSVLYGYGDQTTAYSFSGTTYTANKALYDQDTDYEINRNLGSKDWNFYSLADKFYYGYSSTEYADALTADAEKALGTAAAKENYYSDDDYTVKVTGKIGEDDNITIVITYLDHNDDDADAKSVDNETTVYTYNLVKLGAAE